MKQWFVYSNNVVHGPFTTDQVQLQIQQSKWDTSSFIWWKGQREWMAITEWNAQLPNLLKSTETQKQVSVWYVDHGQNPVGPLTESEMLENLKNANLARVRLWSVGMEKWTNVFDLPDVMDLLGISRRANERAPLMGTVAVTRANDGPQSLMCKAGSISIAGLGMNGAHALKKGDDVQLLIKSSEFPKALHLNGSVVYVTSQGYAGVKFSHVHPESQSFIFDYIKKFLGPAATKRTG